MTELDPINVRVMAEDMATRVLQKVRNELASTEQQGQKTGAGMESLGSSFKQLFAAVGGAYVLHEVAGFLKESYMEAIKTETAMNSLRLQAGKLAETLMGDLRSASRGTVSDLELMVAANRALVFGIEQSQLVPLMEVARARAREMGISVTQAFNDIVTGIARQSPLILDNLGIKGISGAFDGYAKTVGKSADSLNEFEKQQALVNYILKNSEEIVKRQNSVTNSSADSYEQMTAEIANLKAEIGQDLMPAMKEFFTVLKDNKETLRDTASLLTAISNVLIKTTGLYVKFIGDVKDMNTQARMATSDLGMFGETVSNLATTVPGLGTALAYVGTQMTGNLHDAFIKSGLTFEEFTTQMQLNEAQIRALTQAYSESIDNINRTRKIELQVETKQLEDAQSMLASIITDLSTLDSRMNKQTVNTDKTRIELFQSVLGQADAKGQSTVSADESMAQKLGFSSINELKQWLSSMDINPSKSGQVGVKFAGNRADEALQAVDAKSDEIELSQALQESLDAERKLMDEQAVALERASKAQNKLNADQKLYSEEIIASFPENNKLLSERADIAEREADAAERIADSRERELEALKAIASIAE